MEGSLVVLGGGNDVAAVFAAVAQPVVSETAGVTPRSLEPREALPCVEHVLMDPVVAELPAFRGAALAALMTIPVTSAVAEAATAATSLRLLRIR